MSKARRMKRVVCFGGGNGMPRAVLSGLKNKKRIEITAICAMLDTGGSAGRLRKDYKIVSPGDIRRAFIALANTSPAVEELFNYRFETGHLRGHNFANLLITALELSTNDYKKTAREIRKILKISHEVLPATLDKSNLYAVLENGKIISGEENIDKPKHDGNLKIKKVFLKPKAQTYPEVPKAIRKADLIIIGPGDLYSSLAQVLLVEGISEAIKESRAKKIYICNLMTKYGETNNFTVLDFTKEIECYLKKELDYVIYNTQKPSLKKLQNFKRKHPELLDLVRIEQFSDKRKMVGADLLAEGKEILHDPKKLARIIMKFI